MVDTKKKGNTNWGTVAGVGAGVLGVGTGLYFWLHGKGVKAGDTIKATFTFKYTGEGGSFVLLVRFGWWHRFNYLPFGFVADTEFGTFTLPITLPDEAALQKDGSYKFVVPCTIPAAAPKGTLDGEGSILTPDMVPGDDYLLRVGNQNVLKVT